MAIKIISKGIDGGVPEEAYFCPHCNTRAKEFNVAFNKGRHEIYVAFCCKNCLTIWRWEPDKDESGVDENNSWVERFFQWFDKMIIKMLSKRM